MSDLGELPPAGLMEALMKDPVKRGLILQLLNQEKDGFEAYKRREMAKSKHVTPVKRINRLHCESPTALQRRRALEMLHRDTTSESSSSEVSEPASEVQGPQLPFEELLKGVRAYVEVRRNDVDRSEGIKTVMRLMGATIRDKFTSDVTHVVFKDGSFTTYQKAKLMKVHLVSVLWLDAVKRKNGRVPEKNYPAFGSKVSDENVSVLCSQLQKDYEDIIRDEKRRSVSILSQTTSKTVDKNRRRTMMTPQTSMSSYRTAQKSPDFMSDEDREIDAIISQRKPTSPDITSDDSDCGVINGEASKRSKNSDLLSPSSIITNDSSTHTSPKQKKNDTSSSISLLSRNVTVKNRRGTIRVVSDMVITPNIETSEERARVSDKRLLKDSTLQSTMSIDSDRTKSGLQNISSDGKNKRNSKTKDKENSSTTTAKTTMSSLRLSDSFENKENLKQSSKTNLSSNVTRRVTRHKDNSDITNDSRRSRRSSVSPQKSERPKRVTPDSRSRARSVSIRRSISKTTKKTNSSDDDRSSSESEDDLQKAQKTKTIAAPLNDKKMKKDDSDIINDSRRSSRRSSVSSLRLEPPKRAAPHDFTSRARSVSIRRSISKTRKKTKSSADDASSSESDDNLNKAQKTKPIATPLNDKKNGRTVSSDSETENRNKLGTPKKKKTDSEASSTDKTNSKSLKRISSSRSSSVLRSEPRTTPPPVSEEDTKTIKNKRNQRASSITKRNKNAETESLNRFQTPKKKRTESEATSPEKTNSKGRKRMTFSRSDRKKKTSSQASSEEEEDAEITRETKAIKNKKNQRTSTVKSNASKGKMYSTASSDSETEDLNKSSTPKKKRTESEASSTEKTNAKGLKRFSPSKSDSSTKKMRKLYNPDDVSCLVTPVDEDQEREEYQRQKSQKTTDDLFVNPNNVIIPLLQSKNKAKLPDQSDDNEINTQKNTKVKNKNKTKTPPNRDSSADEQRELLELLTKKTSEDDDVRRSRRLSLSQIKPKYTFSSSSEASSVSSLPITPIKRRSTLDFQPLSQTQLKRKLKLDPKRKSSIVCTKMHRQEVVEFENIVRDIGFFFVEDKVTNRTTHLVAAEAKRTINMLRAIIRGCWILRHEWLLESKEEGKWLPEEDYEMTEFSPAVQECRLQRQAFGPTYTSDVFKEVGFIYLAKNTTPKMTELKELIVTCKGRVTSVYRNASVVVGEFIMGFDGKCVTEKWVLDCITFNKVKSFKNYLMRPVNARSPEV